MVESSTEQLHRSRSRVENQKGAEEMHIRWMAHSYMHVTPESNVPVSTGICMYVIHIQTGKCACIHTHTHIKIHSANSFLKELFISCVKLLFDKYVCTAHTCLSIHGSQKRAFNPLETLKKKTFNWGH